MKIVISAQVGSTGLEEADHFLTYHIYQKAHRHTKAEVKS